MLNDKMGQKINFNRPSNVRYKIIGGIVVMDEITREVLFNRLRLWILEAGSYIRQKINEPFTVDLKSGRKDLVTEIDRNVEYFFANRIRKFYPNHSLLTEEGYGDSLKSFSGTVWIIDPIDGTMNFVHQKKNFCISIGIYEQGVGEIGFIYDVMNNDLFSAMRGNGAYKNDRKLMRLDTSKTLRESIVSFNHRWLCPNRLIDERVMQQLAQASLGTRAYGSAALEFALLAEGAIDGYISLRLQPWDIAAGKVIVEEVGGVVSTLLGERINLLKQSTVFVCNKGIQGNVIEKYLKRAKK